MHRYRIIAQISLIFSVFNLVLAAPMLVQEAPTPDSEIVAPEDVVAMPKNSGKLKGVSDMPTPSSPDAMEPPRHSSLSDGLGSSGYSAPHLSSDMSVSGYSWLLERPPRLSPDRPEPSHASTSLQPSSSGPSEIPNPELLHHGLAPPSPPNSGSSIVTPSTPSWLHELEEVIALQVQLDRLDGATTETLSPVEKFTPSYRLSSASSVTVPSTKFASASGGSLTSHYFSASDGLAPSHNSISEAPSSPGPPEDARFLTEKMVKKLKIAGAVTFISTLIAGIAFPLIKHRDYQES